MMNFNQLDNSGNPFGNGLMGKLFQYQKTMYAPKRTASPILSMEELAAGLAAITDEEWGQYAFRRDPIGGKFSPEEKERLIRLSLECGDSYARESTREGRKSPSLIARELGVEVRFPHRPAAKALEGNRVLFAQYSSPNLIEVFTDCTEKMEKAFAVSSLRNVLGDVDVKEVLLAHELFHFFEERDAKTIFTENEKKDLPVLGIFRNSSRILCLGEMAAMRYAKDITGLKYSPYVFDVLLAYLYDKQAACNLYAGIQKLLNPEAGAPIEGQA
jgi:hypothetical protein